MNCQGYGKLRMTISAMLLMWWSLRWLNTARKIQARAPATAIVTIEPTVAPAYMHMAQKYGLADMQLGASRDHDAQTLEQEYQSYITAPLSFEGTDTLRFLEVCNPLFSGFMGIWKFILGALFWLIPSFLFPGCQ